MKPWVTPRCRALGVEIDRLPDAAFTEERQDVDAVDDHRHPGAGCGEAADDAGFRLVGVDDVGLQRRDLPPHRAKGGDVAQRAKLAGEIGDLDQPRPRGEPRGMLRKALVAIHHDDLVALPDLAGAGEQGVFLRAGAKETGQNVEDAHRYHPLECRPTASVLAAVEGGVASARVGGGVVGKRATEGWQSIQFCRACAQRSRASWPSTTESRPVVWEAFRARACRRSRGPGCSGSRRSCPRRSPAGTG